MRLRLWSPADSAKTSDALARFANSRPTLHPEVFAQIESPHVRVRNDVVRRALRQDLAAVNDIGSIDQPEGLPHIMIGNQYADASPFEMAHEILDVADRDRVDAREWLVEEHEGRFAGEG